MKSPEMLIAEEFLTEHGSDFEVCLGADRSVDGDLYFFAYVRPLSRDVETGPLHWARQPLSAASEAIRQFLQETK